MTSRNMRRTRSSTIVFVVLATCLLCRTSPSFCDVRGAPASGDGAGNASHEPKAADKKPAVVEATVKSDVGKSNNTSGANNNNNSKTVEAAAAAADAAANHDAAVLTSKDKPTAAVVKVKNVKSDDAADTEKSPKMPEQPEVGHTTPLNSGALLRGFLVFVGLGVLALAYMVFRSFRLNKSRTQMVRKYGVLAHKQDIEMRPLPLDEDDDDDTTVFDASGLSLPASSSSSRSQS